MILSCWHRKKPVGDRKRYRIAWESRAKRTRREFLAVNWTHRFSGLL